MNKFFDKNEYERWLNEALYTFKSAVKDEEEGDYSWACFKFQQSAELMLKALLRGFGKHSIGHSLLKLLKEIEDIGIKVDNEVKTAARVLDANYIPPRYPDAYPEGSPHEYYDKESANTSYKSTKIIEAFINKIIEDYA